MRVDRKISRTYCYYLYGKLWRSPNNATEGLPVQAYTYQNKERESGMSIYDFGPRRFHAPGLYWSEPDMKASDYPGLWPYTFCASNPIRNIDPDGKDIFVLNAGKHMAILIQDESNIWRYYSVNGSNNRNLRRLSSGRDRNEKNIGNWNSPEEFLNSSYNTEKREPEGEYNEKINAYGFNEGYQITTTKEQDEIIRTELNKIEKDDYNIIHNNCTTTIQVAMKKAGLKTKPERKFDLSLFIESLLFHSEEEIYPKWAFYDIIEANPNGKYISK